MAEHSPWGSVQHSHTYTRGIRKVETAGHGGLVVSPTRMDQMPPALAAVGRRLDGYPGQRRGYGYFEEDCDWAAVAVAFPDLFADVHAEAVRLLANYHPDVYEAHFEVTLAPGESLAKDERTWREAHADRYVVRSAMGNDDGTVDVIAVRDRDQARAAFVVDRDEYRARGRFGFVIDEDRHRPVESSA